jgi:hypothetical protein
MSLVSPPPSQVAMVDKDGVNNPSWVEYFSAIYFSVIYTQQSGTTAKRPTKNLFVNRQYFDTTINRPIWYTGTNWIRADGVVV